MRSLIPTQWLLAAVLAAPARQAERPSGGPPAPAAGAPEPRTASRTAPIYDGKADAAKDIESALEIARRENRRVLLLWGADWCSWSLELSGLLSRNVKLRREIAAEYEVVRIDVGRFDHNGPLLEKYGHDLAHTRLPVLSILDAEGTLLASDDATGLEAKPPERCAYDAAALLALLGRYEAVPLAAEDVLAAALASASTNGLSVFLHFEAPLRPASAKFETWLASPDVAPVLARDFEVVKIDTERMAGGADLLRRLRESDLSNLPWYAVLSRDGHVLATSDGSEGRNIQFPVTKAQLEQFGSMLEKGIVRLKKADLELLKDSLRRTQADEDRGRRIAKKKAQKKADDEDADEGKGAGG